MIVTPTRPRFRPVHWPTGSRPVRVYPRLLAVVTAAGPQLLHVDEAHEERLAVAPLALVEEFVDVALAALAAMHEQVFHLLKAGQVQLELRVAPARRLPHVAAAEAEVTAGLV